MPMLPAMATGSAKSNISKRRIPRSAATATTSRLVEVPIVVPLPPMRVASPIGIKEVEADPPVRNATLTRTGSSITTIGVLFMKALNTPVKTSVASNEDEG